MPFSEWTLPQRWGLTQTAYEELVRVSSALQPGPILGIILPAWDAAGVFHSVLLWRPEAAHLHSPSPLTGKGTKCSPLDSSTLALPSDKAEGSFRADDVQLRTLVHSAAGLKSLVGSVSAAAMTMHFDEHFRSSG